MRFADSTFRAMSSRRSSCSLSTSTSFPSFISETLSPILRTARPPFLPSPTRASQCVPFSPAVLSSRGENSLIRSLAAPSTHSRSAYRTENCRCVYPGSQDCHYHRSYEHWCVQSLLLREPSLIQSSTTAFTAGLVGAITNAGPFDAVIGFPQGLTVAWNGAPLGQIAMPNVRLLSPRSRWES